jgi:hypothetical protein
MRLQTVRPAVSFFSIFVLLTCAIAVPRSYAADPCSDFTWDVSRERALFAGVAVASAAGADNASAPMLVPNKLYALQLRPLSQVTFVTAPGKKITGDAAFGGLATLRISAAGAYRIAVDVPFWIDVVANGGLMNVEKFQGAPGCNAPHKVLEFEFPVPREVVLQFSGDRASSVRVAIVPAAGR